MFKPTSRRASFLKSLFSARSSQSRRRKTAARNWHHAAETLQPRVNLSAVSGLEDFDSLSRSMRYLPAGEDYDTDEVIYFNDEPWLGYLGDEPWLDVDVEEFEVESWDEELAFEEDDSFEFSDDWSDFGTDAELELEFEDELVWLEDDEWESFETDEELWTEDEFAWFEEDDSWMAESGESWFEDDSEFWLEEDTEFEEQVWFEDESDEFWFDDDQQVWLDDAEWDDQFDSVFDESWLEDESWFDEEYVEVETQSAETQVWYEDDQFEDSVWDSTEDSVWFEDTLYFEDDFVSDDGEWSEEFVEFDEPSFVGTDQIDWSSEAGVFEDQLVSESWGEEEDLVFVDDPFDEFTDTDWLDAETEFAAEPDGFAPEFDEQFASFDEQSIFGVDESFDSFADVELASVGDEPSGFDEFESGFPDFESTEFIQVTFEEEFFIDEDLDFFADDFDTSFAEAEFEFGDIEFREDSFVESDAFDTSFEFTGFDGGFDEFDTGTNSLDTFTADTSDFFAAADSLDSDFQAEPRRTPQARRFVRDAQDSAAADLDRLQDSTAREPVRDVRLRRIGESHDGREKMRGHHKRLTKGHQLQRSIGATEVGDGIFSAAHPIDANTQEVAQAHHQTEKKTSSQPVAASTEQTETNTITREERTAESSRNSAVDHVFATSAITSRLGFDSHNGSEAELASLQLASEQWEMQFDEQDVALMPTGIEGAEEVDQARFASLSAATAFTAFYGVRAIRSRIGKQRNLAAYSN